MTPYTDHFLRVMEFVRDSSSKRALLQDFNVRKAHDWVEVRLEAGISAQKQHESRAKGFAGFFPRVARKIGEMGPAVDSFAVVSPSGEYTSLICGG